MILRELVIGYIEEDDEDDVSDSRSRSRGGPRGVTLEEEMNETTGRLPAISAGKTPQSKFRVAGQAVKFVAARGPLGGDALVKGREGLFFSFFCVLVGQQADGKPW